MAITVLSDALVNKIAAGEVVERPASVVRELVDNAVDACAKDISVYVEAGGRSLIRVVDDGCGMDRSDALLAFERHATSKVRSLEDLSAITTMGFRGEALASIASVSKVLLITRAAAEPLGVQVNLQGGRLLDVCECTANTGTDIQIRNIFGNVPARRKFLKQPAVELQRLRLWLLLSSIVRPQIRFRLFSESRELLNLPARSSSLDRAKTVFRGASGVLAGEFGDLRISGVVGHPALAQAGLDSLAIFVNGRLIQDRAVLKAVREGFLSTLRDREYPLGVLQIELPPEDVDVNVHPQKSEVRFRRQREIFAAVRETVSQAVKTFRAPLPSDSSFGALAHNRPLESSIDRTYHAFSPTEDQSSHFEQDCYEPLNKPLDSEVGRMAQELPLQETFRFSELEYIGEALSCYLICQRHQVLYLVDMHAAHERYNYNLIRNRLRSNPTAVQRLLVPDSLRLTEDGLQNCMGHRELLESVGVSIRPNSTDTIEITAIPSFLKVAAIREFIRELAAIPPDEDDGSGQISEKLDHAAARIACHASIRSGYHVRPAEAASLFAALDQSEFSAACPHGRPVVIAFSRQDVERWFGRDR